MRRMLRPLSGPLTKHLASASRNAAASGLLSAESNAKCAVGRSPHAFMILSSIWTEPEVGVAVSAFCSGAFAWGVALGVVSPVFGWGFGSELHAVTSVAATRIAIVLP